MIICTPHPVCLVIFCAFPLSVYFNFWLQTTPVLQILEYTSDIIFVHVHEKVHRRHWNHNSILENWTKDKENRLLEPVLWLLNSKSYPGNFLSQKALEELRLKANHTTALATVFLRVPTCQRKCPNRIGPEVPVPLTLSHRLTVSTATLGTRGHSSSLNRRTLWCGLHHSQPRNLSQSALRLRGPQKDGQGVKSRWPSHPICF